MSRAETFWLILSILAIAMFFWWIVLSGTY
jgi:hypothetical protein